MSQAIAWTLQDCPEQCLDTQLPLQNYFKGSVFLPTQNKSKCEILGRSGLSVFWSALGIRSRKWNLNFCRNSNWQHRTWHDPKPTEIHGKTSLDFSGLQIRPYIRDGCQKWLGCFAVLKTRIKHFTFPHCCGAWGCILFPFGHKCITQRAKLHL